MTIKGLSLSEAIKVPATPFPGLRPFEFHESDLFFGRDGQVEKLIIKLAGARFVAVVGTSGSGKSSLARAGDAGVGERNDGECRDQMAHCSYASR